MEVLSPDALRAYWSSHEVAVNVVTVLNILGALGLGLLVGYERSYHGRAAGMRTYGFVCMASCALTAVSAYPAAWFGGQMLMTAAADPTRIIQGVVTGIGFLGAGVIMKEGFSISGLTTAASIWTASAIGVLVGIGFYAAAIALTLLCTLLMMWGSRLEGFLPARPAINVTLKFRKGFTPRQELLQEHARARGYSIALGTLAITFDGGHAEWQFVAVADGRTRGTPFARLAHDLAALEGIESFRLFPARN
jgi:putative Mg2+ transporter-C (MgtC) family protein